MAHKNLLHLTHNQPSSLPGQLGLIYQMSYDSTPILSSLGIEVMNKVINISRKHMVDKVGCIEIALPCVQPFSQLKTSLRDKVFNGKIYTLENQSLFLAPTHEESMSLFIKSFAQSYKDLPVHLLQYTTKFRREPRTYGGTLRMREFMMQDSYSFASTKEESSFIYESTKIAYKNILEELEIPHVFVTNYEVTDMQGNYSEEIHYLSDKLGEETILTSEDNRSFVLNQAPIGQTHCSEHYQTLYFTLNPDEVIQVCINANRALSYYKLNLVVNCKHKLSESDRLLEKPQTYLIKKIFIDHNCKINTFTDDSQCIYADLHVAEIGDRNPENKLYKQLKRGLEIGHLFDLGTYYSKLFNLKINTRNNTSQYIHMGCYGLGISRLLSVISEHVSQDSGKITWPDALRPIGKICVIADNNTKHKYALKAYEYLQNETNYDVDIVRYSYYSDIPNLWKLGYKLILIAQADNIHKIKLFNPSEACSTYSNLSLQEAQDIINKNIHMV